MSKGVYFSKQNLVCCRFPFKVGKKKIPLNCDIWLVSLTSLVSNVFDKRKALKYNLTFAGKSVKVIVSRLSVFLDINVDLSFSGSWTVLDRLLTCLCRNAEMLSEQGSVLEAKSLLKEALLLSRKFHLSFWYDLFSLWLISNFYDILDSEVLSHKFSRSFDRDGCGNTKLISVPNRLLICSFCARYLGNVSRKTFFSCKRMIFDIEEKLVHCLKLEFYAGIK